MKSKDNIFLAYLRVKNSSYGNSKFDEVEIKYFEYSLENNLKKISESLASDVPSGLSDFRLYHKEKSFKDYRNKDYSKVKSRPLTRYNFYDEVLIQSVFNIALSRLKLNLPRYNFGAILADDDSPFTFERWSKYYSEFKNIIAKNADYGSKFQYVYQFDIENFYPSIDKNNLISRITNDLQSDKVLVKWISYILNHYSSSNVLNVHEQADITGIPQGPDYSRFLSIYYINELKSKFMDKYSKLSKISISDYDLDFIMYVDDGYIFFKNYADETLIKKALDEALNEINTKINFEGVGSLGTNSSSTNQLKINPQKCKFIVMDNKNMRDIFTNITISENRAAIDIEVELTDAQYQSIQKSVDLTQMSRMIVMNEAPKIENLLANQLKRNISKFSKLKIDRANIIQQIDKFMRIKTIFPIAIKDESLADILPEHIVLSNNEKNATNNKVIEEIEPFIDTINFEYVFSNLLEKISNSQDTQYLFSTVLSVFEDVRSDFDSNPPNFHYYECFILNKIFSLSFKELGISLKQGLDFIVSLFGFNEHDSFLNYSFSTDDFYYFIFFSNNEDWRRIIEKYIQFTDKFSLSDCKVNLNDNEKILVEGLNSSLNKLKGFELECIVNIYGNCHFELKTNYFTSKYRLNPRLIRNYCLQLKDNDIGKIKLTRNPTHVDNTGVNVNSNENELLERVCDYYKITIQTNFGDVKEYSLSHSAVISQSNINDYSTFEYGCNVRNLELDGIEKKDVISVLRNVLPLWITARDENRLSPSFLNTSSFFFSSVGGEDEQSSKYVIHNQHNSNHVFIFENQKESYFHLCRKISNSSYKEMLSHFFCRLFKFDITDFHPNNVEDFWIFRIVIALNSERFDIDDFLVLLKRIMDEIEVFSNVLSSDIFKAASIFQYHFKSSDSMVKVDKLLVIHQYYSNVWKNGSKDLFFFTLHNQLHSLTLIEHYHNMSRMHSKLTFLNNYEKFLLFAACYLHDIAMLQEPDVSEKIDFNDDLVLSAYNNYNGFSTRNSVIKPNFIHELYNVHSDMEDIIENIVRREHSYKAGNIIRKITKLPLTSEERDLIGRISKNHGEDSEKVYGTIDKLSYSRDNADVRKVSKFLRVLDLSDVGKERVTEEVLGFYGNRMSSKSLSQWIKHLSTDGIEVEIRHESRDNQIGTKQIIEINILLNYFPYDHQVINKNGESHQCYFFDEKKNIISRKEKSKEIDSGHCNLLCKFINEHYYFEKEVEMLNRYSDSNHYEFIIKYVPSKNYSRYRIVDTGVQYQSQRSFEEILISEYEIS